MYCRKTKIVLFYHIHPVTHEKRMELLKRHVRPGQIILTDSHAAYVHMGSAKSKLAQYGYYHFWVTHNNYEYVHAKFPFVQQQGIECSFGRLKHMYREIIGMKNLNLINDTVNCATARSIVKLDKMYAFTL